VDSENRKFVTLFWITLVVITVLRLLYISSLKLVPQEAYYWNYSRHPALSYLDHPPATAYLIHLLTSLGGDTEFMIHLGAVMVSFLVGIVCFLLAKRMYSARIAFYFTLLLSSILIFSLGAVVTTPDTPFILFWVLAMLFSYRAITDNRGGYWYLWGAAFGFGFLSKYTAVFIPISTFLFLLLSRDNRRWLARPQVYLALLLATLCASPVFIWNLQHGWASFLFQTGRRAGEMVSFRPDFFFGYLGTQLGVVGFLLLPFIVYAVAKSGLLGVRRGDARLLFLFSMSAPILFFFTLTASRTWVKMNWPTAGYVAGILAMLCFYFEKERSKAPTVVRRWKSYGRVALVFTALVTCLLHLDALFPIFGFTASADSVTGYRQLGEVVESVAADMPGRANLLYIGYEYKAASELAFYLPGRPETVSNNLVGRPGLQYDYWADPDTLMGRDAVFVYDQRNAYRELQRLTALFTHLRVEPPLKVYRKNELVTTFHIYRCYDYRGLDATRE
jgi:4-amino-4-deoxy-L-arabinose transferase-like glycosyltransferase